MRFLLAWWFLLCAAMWGSFWLLLISMLAFGLWRFADCINLNPLWSGFSIPLLSFLPVIMFEMLMILLAWKSYLFLEFCWAFCCDFMPAASSRLVLRRLLHVLSYHLSLWIMMICVCMKIWILSSSSSPFSSCFGFMWFSLAVLFCFRLEFLV